MESKWDTLACKLITKYHLKSCLPNRFTNELDIIRRLVKVDRLSEEICGWLLNFPNIRADNEENSNQYRQRGNELFKSKTNDHLALEAYSKAIFAAPERSTALALGHANRAILLIRFGRYQEAFDDCRLALAGGYPESNRLKVYFRQAECAQRLHDRSMLDTVIKCISEAAATTQLSKTEKDKLVELEALRVMLSARSVDNQDKPREELVFPSLKELSNPNVGRHVVTAELIKENSVIAKETAVSFVPVYDADSLSSLPSFDCQKCGHVNIIPFPCSTCGRACYCSSTCRTLHEPVHQYECFGYKKQLWYHIGIAHLGIRSFLDGFRFISSTNSKAKDAHTWFEALKTATEHDAKELGDYGRLFRLVTNFERMDSDDVLQYSLVSFMLAVYLRDCTIFFERNNCPSNIPVSHEEQFVMYGALIFRHVGQLVCNGHAISELRGTLPSHLNCFEKDSFQIQTGLLHRFFTSSRVFTAIFPQISLFNHSCEPNIRNHFEGSTLTVYATRNINANEEIFNCYGPHYKIMPTSERKMCLRRQYCFACNCDRCSAPDDTSIQIYNLIKCPLAGCRHKFGKELRRKELLEGLKCSRCKRKIHCSWYSTILNVIQEDGGYEPHQIREIAQAYEDACRMLTKYNETRIFLQQLILDHYLQYAGDDSYCWTYLRFLVNEFVMLRRHQFGFMSLEYISGCFYLLDLLAIGKHVSQGRAYLVDGEEKKILGELRQALTMVGEHTRSTILHYIAKHCM